MSAGNLPPLSWLSVCSQSLLTITQQMKIEKLSMQVVFHFILIKKLTKPCNWNAFTFFPGLESIEVNPHTPWYDSWRETLWSCLEMTDHDFTRHYLATLLVVSSSHPNPVEQFHQLNNQLNQLIVIAILKNIQRIFLKSFILFRETMELMMVLNGSIPWLCAITS